MPIPSRFEKDLPGNSVSGEPLSLATNVRRPSGFIFIDGQEVGQTAQCCHCGEHFLVVRGSGKRRGYCMECGQVTCGDRRCDACSPFEKRLDLYEVGKIGSLIQE